MLTGGSINNIDVGKISMPLSEFDANAQIYSAYSKMQSEGTSIAAVMKRGRFAGIVQMKHMESVISLHLAHTRGNSKNVKG